MYEKTKKKEKRKKSQSRERNKRKEKLYQRVNMKKFVTFCAKNNDFIIKVV